MIDVTKNIITALKNVAPTYYEFFADGSTPKPCITVQEYSNNDDVYGETLGYSVLQYMIKVWSNSKEEVQSYALQVDPVMRQLGFHRTSGTELYADHQICKLMLYEALGHEVYDFPEEEEQAEEPEDNNED